MEIRGCRPRDPARGGAERTARRRWRAHRRHAPLARRRLTWGSPRSSVRRPCLWPSPPLSRKAEPTNFTLARQTGSRSRSAKSMVGFRRAPTGPSRAPRGGCGIGSSACFAGDPGMLSNQGRTQGRPPGLSQLQKLVTFGLRRPPSWAQRASQLCTARLPAACSARFPASRVHGYQRWKAPG